MYDRIKLLGNAQDAGRPQIGCTQKCCTDARKNSNLSRMPVSLGLQGETYGLVEATKSIGNQLSLMDDVMIDDPAHKDTRIGLLQKIIEIFSPWGRIETLPSS